MRSFLGGISKHFFNWHYVPVNYNIFEHKNSFIIESTIKSISCPPLQIGEQIIQLHELNRVYQNKVILEYLEKETRFEPEKAHMLRKTYPCFYFIERDIKHVEKNTCHKIEYYVQSFLKTLKRPDITTLVIDKNNTGLYVIIP